MRKVLMLLPVLSIAIAMIAGPVLASTITDADYYANLTVSNTGGSISGGVVSSSALKTDDLITAGYLSPTINNVAVRDSSAADVPFMPGYDNGSTWMFFVNSLAGGGQTAYAAYMGGTTDMDASIRWFPDTAGGSMADAATMEPGTAAYTSIIKGWVNTTDSGAAKRLVYKSDSLSTWVSAANTISTKILDAGTSSTVYPSGDASIGLSFSTGANHYTEIDETPASDADYIGSKAAPGAAESDYYDTPTPVGPVVGDTISAFAVTVRISGTNTGSPGYVVPVVKSGAKTVTGTSISTGVSGTWTTTTLTLNNTAGITVSELTDLQLGLTNVHCDGTNWIFISQAYITVIILPRSIQVDAAGITSGDHIINSTWNGTELKISVDGVEKDSDIAPAGFVSVADKPGNWYWCENNCMPYVDYIKFYLGGVLVQDISWQHDTIFSDSSGHNHDITPTFRSTSTTDLSASMSAFYPMAIAASTAKPTTGSTSISGGTPSTPGADTADINLPLADVINPLLDLGEIPRLLFWYPAVFIPLAVGIIWLWPKAPSVWITMLAGGVAFIGLGLTGGAFGWCMWVSILFFLSCIFTAMKRQGASV